MSRTSTAANNAAILAKINGSKPTATKPSRTKAKTVVEPTPAPVVEAANVAEPDEATLYERARASVQQLFDSIEMPSWTRKVVATVTAIIVAGATAYSVMTLLDMLLLAVLTYTTNQFVLFMIAFTGMMLAMIACVSAATKTFELVIEFDIRRIKSRVSGWFSPKPLIDDAAPAR